MTSYIIILKLIVMFLPDCSILRKYACCLCILSLHSLLWDAKDRSTSHTALLLSGSHKAEFTGLGSWYQLVWERYPMAILWFAVSVESCFLYNYPNWCNICCSSTVYPFVVWMTGLFIYLRLGLFPSSFRDSCQAIVVNQTIEWDHVVHNFSPGLNMTWHTWNASSCWINEMSEQQATK